jgi:uncharacterized protein (TIGR02996 family)
MPRLWNHPQVVALLQSIKEAPEDDGPRLVLADWLEDHGGHGRAEFIRTQLRLAPGAPQLGAADERTLKLRASGLLDENGGDWLGPLWRYWLSPSAWHRGLLSFGAPRGVVPEQIEASLSWADTLVCEAGGHRSFARLQGLVELAAPNHLVIDLRRPVREDRLAGHLSFLRGSANLRTLSFEWPLGLVRKEGPDQFTCHPDVSAGFLAALLGGALSCRLTHLSSSPGWSAEQAAFIRSLGVEPVRPDCRLWMHALPATDFGLPSRKEEP